MHKKNDRPGALRDIGIHNLGAYHRSRFWECVDCGTTYPSARYGGGATCNGRRITRCLCADKNEEQTHGTNH